MSDGTHISWADATWSPVTGCTRISEGCTHCYIERTPPFRMQHRTFDKPGIGGTTGIRLHEDRLRVPLHWRKPRRIFVCSLADLFHDGVPDEFLAEVFAVMALTPLHIFQVLTKRPARMRALLSSAGFQHSVTSTAALFEPRGVDVESIEWPLSNVWCGVSVETQQWADIRIPALLDTPAAVRWISAEPLLEPVDLHWCAGVNAVEPDWTAGTGAPHPLLDWVVVGGESGPGARPMHPDWPRSLRDQCQAAGVAYHFKQWGEWCRSDQLHPDEYQNQRLDAATNLTENHPEPIRVGKRRAGRLLDERTWDEYPDGGGQ